MTDWFIDETCGRVRLNWIEQLCMGSDVLLMKDDDTRLAGVNISTPIKFVSPYAMDAPKLLFMETNRLMSIGRTLSTLTSPSSVTENTPDTL